MENITILLFIFNGFLFGVHIIIIIVVRLFIQYCCRLLPDVADSDIQKLCMQWIK